jgi:hypothetical protein
MPTGYTAGILRGLSFPQFALNCARAFGACVTLRDDPIGMEAIPGEFEPDGHHYKEAAQARQELAELQALTPEQCEQRALVEWKATETARLARLERRRKDHEAYEATLTQVNAWVPPTPEHVELQKFMRCQIEESIERDCVLTYDDESPPRPDGEPWWTERISDLVESIARHDRCHERDVTQAAERTSWIRALRASL